MTVVPIGNGPQRRRRGQAQAQAKRIKAPTGFVAVTTEEHSILIGLTGPRELYAELRRRAGSAGQIQVRQTTVARSLGVSLKTIKRRMAQLKALGLVAVVRTPQTAYYHLPLSPHYSQADRRAAAALGRFAANNARRYTDPETGQRTHDGRRFDPETDPRIEGSPTPVSKGHRWVTYDPSISKDSSGGGVLTDSSSSGGSSTSPHKPEDSPTPDGPQAGAEAPAPWDRPRREHWTDSARQAIPGRPRSKPPEESLLDPEANEWAYFDECWYEVHSLAKAQAKAKHSRARLAVLNRLAAKHREA